MNTMYPRSVKAGFTIVELLVVIVVIGILASITYVAYGNVQNTSKTQQARSNAAVLQQKIEAYGSVVGNYPNDDTVSAYTAALNSRNESSISASGITIVSASGSNKLSSSSATSTMEVFLCSTPSEVADATAYKIVYWDYSKKAETTTPFSADLSPTKNCSTWTTLN